MTDRVFVVGVGMSPFAKPGTKAGDYPDWAAEAGRHALADAAISFDDIEAAFIGYCYGESTAGQRALYELGLTGIPAVNVNNNCSTGSTALYLARQAVAGGSARCAIALGFEKMQRGSLQTMWTDRVNPLDRHLATMHELWPQDDTPFAVAMFGNAGREHMERYGSRPEHFAWIGWKNHHHSVHNPYAQFRTDYTEQEVQDATMVYEPLTKLQCSPTSDGAACVIVANERFVDEHDLWDRSVEILAQSLVTDFASTFDSGSMISMVGADISKEAARRVYEEAQLGPEDVDVIELHDCFSVNELLTYEALGLAETGEGQRLVEERATTYGGRWVVNPSGGLISKGHPLGATGLAQCSELTWQLRGEANGRQVQNAQVALQHNVGLGGAAVVALYRKPT